MIFFNSRCLIEQSCKANSGVALDAFITKGITSGLTFYANLAVSQEIPNSLGITIAEIHNLIAKLIR
jgi:hypothetical protein